MERFCESFMERYGVVPLTASAGEIVVGSVSPPGDTLQQLIRTSAGRRVVWKKLTAPEVTATIQRVRAGIDGSRTIGGSDTEGGVSISESPADAPAVSYLNSLLFDALCAGASDIHLQTRRRENTVRYRVDGRLRSPSRLPAIQHGSLAGRIKIVAGMNTAERRVPQDGSFRATLHQRVFDVRVATMPTVGGEAIVLRLLPVSDRAMNLADIGLPSVIAAELTRAVGETSGMIVIAGPTGSGKTTTLHALLRSISRETRKLVTIEDPVEYHLPGIDQIQTDSTAEMGFAQLLRRVLRQDPDVIMVGEIRDSETASMAFRAATTGHLVLTTVHSRSSAEATQRFVELGISEVTVSRIAPLVISQRLVRKRCIRCGGEPGCAECAITGYLGRTGLFDASRAGSIISSFNEHAGRLIRRGITTPQEIRWAIGLS